MTKPCTRHSGQSFTQLPPSCPSSAGTASLAKSIHSKQPFKILSEVPFPSTPIQTFHQPNPTPTSTYLAADDDCGIRNLAAQDPEFLSELLCISSACVGVKRKTKTREEFDDDIRKYKVLDTLAQSCISDRGQIAAMAASIYPREPGSVSTTIYLVFNSELKQSQIDNTLRHLERILDLVRDMHLLTEFYDFGWSRFAQHVLERAHQFEIVKEAVLKDKEESESFFTSFQHEMLDSVFEDIDYIIEDARTRNSTGRLPDDFIGLVFEMYYDWKKKGILEWDSPYSILVKLDRFLSESTMDTVLFSMQLPSPAAQLGWFWEVKVPYGSRILRPMVSESYQCTLNTPNIRQVLKLAEDATTITKAAERDHEIREEFVKNPCSKCYRQEWF
ncbi:hypothetical protein BT96DRAFT_1005963 [Gymnopus androsaceus JB14]|uniref:Uncharacterized protein n=1 Tax=Gymnopus androsaceus JB14 TaxID=1447944 RepID=A0A6A4GML1_9AGAR|nr:hypothetical protein BT96DRAFT_1005963 [Gymnopus androsaceus JB14]